VDALTLLMQLDMNPWHWFFIFVSAFLIGFSKTGVSGVMMLTIPMLAAVFGGKLSTGVILPMLMVGDVVAVIYYHHHADWRDILKLLPWTVMGLLIGVFVGDAINDRQFAILIAVSLLACLAVLVYLEQRSDAFQVPQSLWFWGLIGIVTGFTTMVGNAAGPIFVIYLLAMRIPKYQFLGITAWFFLVINLIKLPLQVFFWHNITLHSALTGVMAIPAILVGAILGAAVVRKLPERRFRNVIIGVTFLAAMRLFF
jgi:uncharacterized protein